MEGMTIQERPYSGISRAHYRVGCHRCTRHHDGRECPPLPVSENTDLDNSSSSNTDNNISNNTIHESFMSADSEGISATHNISEEMTETSEHASDNDDNDDKSDQTREATIRLVPMESPDLTLGFSPSLRSNNQSTSRSSSAQKRELEKSNGSPTDAGGKKQCTKTKSQSPKGRNTRVGNQKQLKK